MVARVFLNTFCFKAFVALLPCPSVGSLPANSGTVLVNGCGEKTELFQPNAIVFFEFFLKDEISLNSHANVIQRQ